MNSTMNLGFIGLGQMGAPMAERLLGPGITLHIHDPSPTSMAALVAKGAVGHESPRAVADYAAIVFACLPSQDISTQAALGDHGVIGGKSIRLYVEMSTIGKQCIETIADRLATRSIATVDGPISGGPPAAREGRLAMMASGAPAALAQARPWLSRIGAKVYELGDKPGQAQIMKLVNNLVMAANMVVASEGLVMGAKAGLDPDLMMEVLNAGTGRSAASADIISRSALPGTFDFGARLSIVKKDVELGVNEAMLLDVPVPVIESAGKMWKKAAEDGLRDDDFTTIIKLVEKHGGATVRSRTR